MAALFRKRFSLNYIFPGRETQMDNLKKQMKNSGILFSFLQTLFLS